MRTTVDIDDDILLRLRQRAHRASIPLKKAVNAALRAALDGPPPADREPYRCPTFSMGEPAAGVDLDRALTLADELEDEEVLRELELRK